jgi:hypothetical protein
MNTLLFLCINFIVAFVSDIVLNDASTNYNFVSSLKPYYRNQSIIKLGIYAGLTIEFGLLVTMLIYYLICGSLLPNNYKSFMYFCGLAFLIGYMLDIAINKLKIFGNKLDLYYKELGAGFWGATAFVFCIVISYFIENNLYILCNE